MPPCSSARTSPRPAGIERALERAAELGCESVQIFTQNSRTWRPTDHSDEDVARLPRDAAQRAVGPAVAHAHLLHQPREHGRPEVYRKSVARCATTARNARRLGARRRRLPRRLAQGRRPRRRRCRRSSTGCAGAVAELGDDAWLLLENSAGAGDTIGRDIDELARVLEAVDHPRVGLCIDTCHVYVSGVDIRERATPTRSSSDIDREIGLERLRCLHVNDAAAPLRHEPRPPREHRRRARSATAIGVLLSHPAPAGPAGDPGDAGAEGKGTGRDDRARERAAVPRRRAGRARRLADLAGLRVPAAARQRPGGRGTILAP